MRQTAIALRRSQIDLPSGLLLVLALVGEADAAAVSLAIELIDSEAVVVASASALPSTEVAIIVLGTSLFCHVKVAPLTGLEMVPSMLYSVAVPLLGNSPGAYSSSAWLVVVFPISIISAQSYCSRYLPQSSQAKSLGSMLSQASAWRREGCVSGQVFQMLVCKSAA